MSQASELYPENYDFSVLFETVADQKIRHDMKHKDTEAIIRQKEDGIPFGKQGIPPSPPEGGYRLPSAPRRCNASRCPSPHRARPAKAPLTSHN